MNKETEMPDDFRLRTSVIRFLIGFIVVDMLLGFGSHIATLFFEKNESIWAVYWVCEYTKDMAAIWLITILLRNPDQVLIIRKERYIRDVFVLYSLVKTIDWLKELLYQGGYEYAIFENAGITPYNIIHYVLFIIFATVIIKRKNHDEIFDPEEDTDI